MNVYDTANKLAGEIKTSEEYNNFKIAKETINLNQDLKNKWSLTTCFDDLKFMNLIKKDMKYN